MKQNVPLFDCPQRNFEEMYYFRWWTLRKHIENTPVGYAMTEFLVPRSYADKYNLIASGVGHHIHESRWIRDGKYLDGILNTWYHGNDGLSSVNGCPYKIQCHRVCFCCMNRRADQ
jgi:hypothetical protein